MPLARWQDDNFRAVNEILLGVRPEELSLTKESDSELAMLRGTVCGVEPLGAETLVMVELEGGAGEITARLHRDTSISVGDAVGLQCAPEAIYLFDAVTEKAIVANDR